MTAPRPVWAALAALLLLAPSAPALAQDLTPATPSAQDFTPATHPTTQELEPFIGEDIIQDILDGVLGNLTEVDIPALPTFTVDMGDRGSISMSLNDIHVSGLNTTNVIDVPLPSWGYHQRVELALPKISLTVGGYISKGHFLTLPFNGEGPMYLHLHNLFITLGFDWADICLGFKCCAAYNSTTIDLDLQRLEVHFENLNSGSDLGQLVDIMFSSFGQDIVEYVQLLIERFLHQPLDNALISIINTAMNCPDFLGDNQEMSPIIQIVEDLLTTLLKFNINDALIDVPWKIRLQ